MMSFQLNLLIYNPNHIFMSVILKESHAIYLSWYSASLFNDDKGGEEWIGLTDKQGSRYESQILSAT